MEQGERIRQQGTGRDTGIVPVRGTQSFVGVMAEVFKRPSLTGLEVLWRWVFWFAVLAWPLKQSYRSLLALFASMQATGFGGWAGWWSYPLSVKINNFAEEAGLGVLLVLLWAACSAAGRIMLLRRVSPGSRPRFVPALLIGVMRWFWWAAAVGLWTFALLLALRHFVNRPLENGVEPQWVVFCGVEIVATLTVFVAWLATSCVFPLAMIYSVQNSWGALRSLGEASRRGTIRAKLSEINLVMGIVKIALIVLAMVFSACPLPFQSVETQQFLVTWTAVVLILYCLASDYFHVVRVVAFLRMTEVFQGLPKVAAAPPSELAS